MSKTAAPILLFGHSGQLGWELRRSLELLGYWVLYRPRGLRKVTETR